MNLRVKISILNLTTLNYCFIIPYRISPYVIVLYRTLLHLTVSYRAFLCFCRRALLAGPSRSLPSLTEFNPSLPVITGHCAWKNKIFVSKLKIRCYSFNKYSRPHCHLLFLRKESIVAEAFLNPLSPLECQQGSFSIKNV